MEPELFSIPVEKLQGVSSRKAEELHALGLFTVGDLLEHYPFRYEDYRVRSLVGAKDGEKITVAGVIATAPNLQRYGRKTRLVCRVRVEQALIAAVWFNRPYLREQLVPGREIVMTGKWDARRRQLTVAESEFPDRGGGKSGTLQPVYSVGGGITQDWMRRTIARALDRYGAMIPEILPAGILDRYRFMPRREAVMRIHRPGKESDGAEARRRMVYEELFLFELKLQAHRSLVRRRPDGVAHRVSAEDIRAFAASLPFELTDGQKQAFNEILRDMRQPYPMNRLLQGDVGSGKTVVAAMALYATVRAGCQGALMVPTEILAEQHARTLRRFLEPHGVRVGLLTGSMTERQRRDALAELQMGMMDVVVGTHALIQEDVHFRRLGLVVTDEQHRFGVQQRSILRRKGMNPDVLAMTATPIPRTLAITVYGDMDVSTIRERPKGRKPVKTYWVKPERMDRVIGFMRREAEAGRQAFVICPLIEESEKLDVQNAIDLHARLRLALPDHGKPVARKDDAGGEGRGDGGIRRGQKQRAGLHHGGGSGGGCAERDADGGDGRRPVRPVPASSAARPRRKGRASFQLRPGRGPENGSRRRTHARHDGDRRRLRNRPPRPRASRSGGDFRHEAERSSGIQAGRPAERFRRAGAGSGRCGAPRDQAGILDVAGIRPFARPAAAG